MWMRWPFGPGARDSCGTGTVMVSASPFCRTTEGSWARTVRGRARYRLVKSMAGFLYETGQTTNAGQCSPSEVQNQDPCNLAAQNLPFYFGSDPLGENTCSPPRAHSNE